MDGETPQWIWWNGRFVPWAEATVHVSTHALHYGSSVFEGIRAYETAEGPAIFRLGSHLRRLVDSAKLLRMELEQTAEGLAEVCVELVRRNRHSACYLRPLVFRGGGGLGLYPLERPVEIAILSFPWGRYLGREAIEEGVDVAVSSWRRPGPGSWLPLGKIGGQYTSNQLASIEARRDGYAEAIVLDDVGYACEGAGENLFVVRRGALVTPPLAASILEGITRDTVLTLAADLGIPVRTEPIPRDLLYLADELFLTGTAAEITPVRSVDGIAVGSGRRGPVTERLQEAFFAVVAGKVEDRHGWLTTVTPEVPVADGAPASEER